MNVNLASKITEYKIDAYGVMQYERIQEDQKTPLIDIEDMDSASAKLLTEAGFSLVSDLLDADMEDLLNVKGISEDSLDQIYESVQNFIEREIEIEEEEEEIDLLSMGIDLETDSVGEETDKVEVGEKSVEKDEDSNSTESNDNLLDEEE